MLNDEGGRELLFKKYGLRKVPVVARGDKYVLGQSIDAFAEFVGLQAGGIRRLAPEELFEKYRKVFAAGQRHALQLPDKCLYERVIPNRDRTIRRLSYHVFRIGEAFLEVWDGAEHTAIIADNFMHYAIVHFGIFLNDIVGRTRRADEWRV